MSDSLIAAFCGAPPRWLWVGLPFIVSAQPDSPLSFCAWPCAIPAAGESGRWAADRVRHVSICAEDSIVRDRIDVRRRIIRAPIETYISVAQIVPRITTMFGGADCANAEEPKAQTMSSKLRESFFRGGRTNFCASTDFSGKLGMKFRCCVEKMTGDITGFERPFPGSICR